MQIISDRPIIKDEISIYITVNTYIYVCVCVCVCVSKPSTKHISRGMKLERVLFEYRICEIWGKGYR